MSDYSALPKTARPNKPREKTEPIPGEQWRKIEEGGGIYYSSDHGRFRKVYRDQSGKIHDYILKLRALNGSMGVSLTISPGNTIGCQAGRIILMVWRPEETPQYVAYRDGDFHNLKLDNLFWACKKEINNLKHQLGNRRRKLVPKTYKTAMGKVKTKMVLFSDKEKEEMKQMYQEGIAQSVIAEQFRGTQAYISKIVRNIA